MKLKVILMHLHVKSLKAAVIFKTILFIHLMVQKSQLPIRIIICMRTLPTEQNIATISWQIILKEFHLPQPLSVRLRKHLYPMVSRISMLLAWMKKLPCHGQTHLYPNIHSMRISTVVSRQHGQSQTIIVLVLFGRLRILDQLDIIWMIMMGFLLL